MSTKRKWVQIVFGSLAGAFMVHVAMQAYVAKERNGGGENSLMRSLRQSSEKMNKHLPATVGRYTRLDTTFVGPGKKITFEYTVTSPNASRLTPALLQTYAGKAFRKQDCANQNQRRYLDLGVVLVYRYKMENGDELGAFTVSRSDCR